MKKVLHLGLVVAACAIASSSPAQTFPNKPIRFIIGYPLGSSIDAVGRLIGNEFEKKLGQPVILDVRPGANGTIGAKTVVNAAPDGYTLWYGPSTGIHPLFNRNNGVDSGKDLASVSHATSAPFFLFTRSQLPAATYQELVAYTRANPDVAKHGAPTPTVDLVMAMLKHRSGLATRSIPYKGTAQVIPAMLSGEVDMTALVSLQAFMPHIQSGAMRALFVAAAQRTSLMPGVPTSAEVGLAGFELANNNGLWAPLGTPREIIQKLSAETAAAVRLPAVSEQIRKGSGAEPVGSTPEEQIRSYDADAKFWAEAARLANFQAP
jgi:tripartite-type tricarboxylate transporter receptor subunit TctC